MKKSRDVNLYLKYVNGELKKGYNMKHTLFFLAMIIFLFGCKETVDPLDQNKLTASVMNKNPTCKKDNSLALKIADTPDTLSCIEYSYDANKKQLLLTHINTVFNCCLSGIDAEAVLNGDSIVVNEQEKLDGYGCHCVCLYDLDVMIENVSLQRYYLKINDESLNFEPDLTKEVDGYYCVTKKEYPWGMSLTR